MSLNSGEFFNFWAAHFDYEAYGPYAANNKMVTEEDQIMAGEHPSSRAGWISLSNA